jgi:NADH pyrophosphatase NudC (nudix superfamily)
VIILNIPDVVLDLMNNELIYGDEYEGCYDMNKYCPMCGAEMKTKTGKYGKFRGCSNFPKCDWAEDWQEYGQIIDNRK